MHRRDWAPTHRSIWERLLQLAAFVTDAWKAGRGPRNFSIFDSGNLAASYDEEPAALDVLAELVRDDPEASGELVLVAFDDDGEPAGEPVLGSSMRLGQLA